jgi:hypothetical protein
VLDWLKDRAGLVAEAREAREQAVLYAGQLAAVDQELRYERAVLVEQVGPVGSPPAFRTEAAELLAERARADQLAELVGQLQEANMRAGCRHGIPLVEAGS